MGIVCVLIALIVTFVIRLAYVVVQTYKKQGHERVHYLVNTMLKLAIVVLTVGLTIVFVIDHFETISGQLYLIFKKKEIDEAMVDRIVEETKKQKNLKEQIYDKINVPVWALDVLIVVLVAALLLVIVFGRGGA